MVVGPVLCTVTLSIPTTLSWSIHMATHIGRGYGGDMDIDTFYEQNEARRESAEFEFGIDWTDAAGNAYELSWIEATGELYLMIEPEAVITEDVFGDFAVSTSDAHELEVVVIAKISSLEAVERALEGWQDAQFEECSLGWLYDRFPQKS